MQELFARTLSQGLQAFMPIAVCVAWLRINRDRTGLVAVRWAIAIAIPLTAAAGWLFQKTPDQPQWQSLLALTAGALAVAFGSRVWRAAENGTEGRLRNEYSRASQLAIGAAAVLIIVRQTMEIAAVFGAAAFQVRSLDATAIIAESAALALIVAIVWVVFSRAFTLRAGHAAAKAFTMAFVAQAAYFAFHKAAEARYVPWAEVLDPATEPYGPDSLFGYRVSYLLVALPLVAAVASLLRARAGGRVVPRSSMVPRRRTAVATCVTLAAAAVVLAAMKTRDIAPVRAASVAPVAVEAKTLASAPHMLFRETGNYSNYGVLSIAPLATPGAARAAAGLNCERISFAAGRGICLQADRGVFTTYKAVTFDEHFQPRASFKLDGSPSRTRISRDGRVGAITVFLTGQVHGYASSTFSTKTTLLDMASEEVLGDLETFTTRRDGARFHAADFNFWGVTFARDSNTFYATLLTGGKTYLVRGDLGLRTLTVLHENVECPSISPDNRLIAYKKRVGGNLSPWRLYVLELATMKERAVAAEARSFDDQIEWLDDGHVLYAMRESSQSAITDVWVAPIDGNEPARVFLKAADSPAVVH